LGWTERHTIVAAAYAVGFAGSLIGLAEGGPVAFWVAGAVVLAAVCSLAVDAFGGLVIGLAVGAGLIAVKRFADQWHDEAFFLALAETLVLLAVGTSAGLAGSALRRRTGPAPSEEPAALIAPVFGSLGLLNHDVAIARLEEEVERARDHRRPLTLLLIEAEITDATLDTAAREGVLRAVARTIESRLHARDVPFAISPERLGAILPEATVADGWQRLGHVIDALAEATFTSRSSRTRPTVADTVILQAGLAELGSAVPSADALLDAAAAGLDRNRALAEEMKTT
jgi:GGDEF domain-containing protein